MGLLVCILGQNGSPMLLQKIFYKYIFLPLYKRELMPCFYVEKKSRLNDIHVVHKDSCELLPIESGRIALGISPNIEEAIQIAKKKYNKVRPCRYCSSKLGKASLEPKNKKGLST